MKLVGSFPGLPTDWVIYDAADWGYPSTVNVLAMNLVCYGVVGMDGDDAPGRMVPFVLDPRQWDGVLRPLQDVPSCLGLVHGAISSTDAVDMWVESHPGAGVPQA